MQNTLVRGEGEMPLKIRVMEKNVNGKRKKGGKLHKTGEKGLKDASFWVIYSKNFRIRAGFSPARRKLIRREKKMNLKRGAGGNDRIARYISLDPDPEPTLKKKKSDPDPISSDLSLTFSFQC